MKSQASKKSSIISTAIGILLMLIIFEILSSLVLIYTYRSVNDGLTGSQGEISRFSSVNLINRVAMKTGLSDRTVMYSRETNPAPFIIEDPVMGYSASAGEYTHNYLRKRNSQKDWESFKTKVTINNDRSRWTGNVDGESLPKIYILGDSFAFGSGVNDEQTFSFLLQNAMPSYEVKLFALGGYSLTQAYLRLESLNESITSSDIVILGYADFYDERHAMSPGRVRSINKWIKLRDPDKIDKDRALIKASLDENGEIQHSYISRICSKNDGYCDKKDPGRSEMTDLTAALVNHIADHTKAKVYIVHLAGKSDNPVFELINDKVTRISALPEDFDYFIRDNIEGFDNHPGPYWHYAMSRKLLETLSK